METLSKEQVLRLHNALLRHLAALPVSVTTVYWNLL